MVSQSAPASRADAYAALTSTREALRRAIGGLTPDQMSNAIVEGWSVKDMLTHISSWDELMAQDFRRMARGQQPVLMHFAPDKTDEWNNATMSMRLRLPLDQVLAEMESSRKDMIDSLDALGDDVFTSGFVPTVLGICGRHDEEHSELIEKWRKEAGV